MVYTSVVVLVVQVRSVQSLLSVFFALIAQNNIASEMRRRNLYQVLLMVVLATLSLNMKTDIIIEQWCLNDTVLTLKSVVFVGMHFVHTWN